MKADSLKIVLVMCIGIFMTMLDTTIMNITIPAIVQDMHISLENISWALNIYTILFAVCSIPFGRIAEIYGRNKVYMMGLVVFALGSMMCGISEGSGMLIASRAVQSLGAAILFPTSMVIGVSSVPLSKRSTALALLGMTQGLAAALGPTVGGIITEYFSWRYVFFVNVPISVAALILCLFLLKFRGESRLRVSIDWPGLALSSLAILSVVLVLVKGQSWGWLSPGAVACYIAFPIALSLFLWVESRVKYPMIPLKLFGDRQFNGAAVTVVVSSFFLVGVTVLLPTFLTGVQGKSELSAALLVTPISAMIFVFSPLAALIIRKIGTVLTVCVGFALMGTAYYVLYSGNLEQGHFWLILGCMLLGAGYGTIAGPITVLAASSFEGELLAASQSVAAVLRQIGVVLAVAVYVSTLTHNIDYAKQNIMQFAGQEATAVHLTDRQRAVALEQTKQMLAASSGTDGSTADDASGSNAPNSAAVSGSTALNSTAVSTGSTTPNSAAGPTGSNASTGSPAAAGSSAATAASNSVQAGAAGGQGGQENGQGIGQFAAAVADHGHQEIKKAYLNLYRYSFPFVMISISVGLLFWKRKEKPQKELAAVNQ